MLSQLGAGALKMTNIKIQDVKLQDRNYSVNRDCITLHYDENLIYLVIGSPS